MESDVGLRSSAIQVLNKTLLYHNALQHNRLHFYDLVSWASGKYLSLFCVRPGSGSRGFGMNHGNRGGPESVWP